MLSLQHKFSEMTALPLIKTSCLPLSLCLYAPVHLQTQPTSYRVIHTTKNQEFQVQTLIRLEFL
jgi:hypothetical protein